MVYLYMHVCVSDTSNKGRKEGNKDVVLLARTHHIANHTKETPSRSTVSVTHYWESWNVYVG